MRILLLFLVMIAVFVAPSPVGAVSGTPSVVLSTGAKIAHLDHEVAYGWTAAGKQAFYKVGERFVVDVTKISRSLIPDGYVLHNHPNACVAPDAIDLQTSASFNVRETWVVGRDVAQPGKVRYTVMRRVGAAWPAILKTHAANTWWEKRIGDAANTFHFWYIYDGSMAQLAVTDQQLQDVCDWLARTLAADWGMEYEQFTR